MEVLISYDELKKSSVQAKKDEKVKLESSIKKYKKKIVKLKRDKLAMYEDYKIKKISKVEFIDGSDEINTEIVEMEKKAIELKKIIEKELVYEESEGIKITKAFYGTNTLTKELYDAFIKEITVYSVDRIEIRFRFGNEFREITCDR
jgi:hypothetical protein